MPDNVYKKRICINFLIPVRILFIYDNRQEASKYSEAERNALRSYGFELLDRMLGLKGCGCEVKSCETKADAKCGAEKEKAKKCGAEKEKAVLDPLNGEAMLFVPGNDDKFTFTVSKGAAVRFCIVDASNVHSVSSYLNRALIFLYYFETLGKSLHTT